MEKEDLNKAFQMGEKMTNNNQHDAAKFAVNLENSKNQKDGKHDSMMYHSLFLIGRLDDPERERMNHLAMTNRESIKILKKGKKLI
jgi:hypothetical protein